MSMILKSVPGRILALALIALAIGSPLDAAIDSPTSRSINPDFFSLSSLATEDDPFFQERDESTSTPTTEAEQEEDEDDEDLGDFFREWFFGDEEEDSSYRTFFGVTARYEFLGGAEHWNRWRIGPSIQVGHYDNLWLKAGVEFGFDRSQSNYDRKYVDFLLQGSIDFKTLVTASWSDGKSPNLLLGARIGYAEISPPFSGTNEDESALRLGFTTGVELSRGFGIHANFMKDFYDDPLTEVEIAAVIGDVPGGFRLGVTRLDGEFIHRTHFFFGVEFAIGWDTDDD